MQGSESEGRDGKGRANAGTRAVRGTRAAPAAGAPLATPIDRSVTWTLDDEAYALRRAGRGGEARVYARETNPNSESLERRLADLEGAERGVVFGSGLAALHTLLLALVERGDSVVLARRVYGGTSSLCARLLEKLGAELRPVELDDPDSWRSAIDASTRLFLCESISNPLTDVADLPAMAEVLHERAGARSLLVVDATLASPVLQRPLEHGADLVWHSATKVLGGHSDALAGVVLGSEECTAPIRSWRTSSGACLDPAAAFLVERGLKTLPLRVEAQSRNALALARFLEAHPAVRRVHYCGLPSHPSHARAKRLLDGCGGLVSFEHAGGDRAALEMIRRLSVFTEASSLGGVESLATRPIDLSHDELDAEERRAAGIGPGLVRLAVGVEDESDLLADLDRALAP